MSGGGLFIFDHKLMFSLFKYPAMARLFTATEVCGQKPGM